MSTPATSQEVPISVPASIWDFADQQYLKKPWPTLTTCSTSPPPAPVSSAAVHLTTGPEVNLETLAVNRNPGLGPITPLADINQGSTNACSSFAFAQAYTIAYALAHPGRILPQLSPIFAYYFQRVQECTTTGVCPCPTCPVGSSCPSHCEPPCVDCGSYILSATTVYAGGVATSQQWPLSSPLNAAPSPTARQGSINQRITKTACVPVTPASEKTMASSIHAHLLAGHVVIVFINVTPSDMAWMQSMLNRSDATLADVMWPGPSTSSEKSADGHIVCVVGYDPTLDGFIIRNSYGFSWGAQGRFVIPSSQMGSPLIHDATAVITVQ